MHRVHVPRLHWGLPPDDRRLVEPDVHVWAAGLDVTIEKLSSYKQALSLDERRRAARFQFDHQRKRFIAGRGILREILSSYLDVKPIELKLDYSPLGKPSIAGFSEKLQFNLTYSNNLILIAITRVCAIGIDVEYIKLITDIENVARNFFSTEEAERLMALAEDDRVSAFYKIFVRKEAYLKAMGVGLSDTIRQIEVSFLRNEPARIRSIHGDKRAGVCWTLMELTPAFGFTGAVAAAEKNLRFLLWQWPR